MRNQKRLKPCSHPICNALTRERFCGKHKGEHNRLSSNDRGYNHRWRKASKQYLSAHPLCVYCFKEEILKGADVVDHIKPHRGNQMLFWDTNNWQPLCKRCHDQKTARELQAGLLSVPWGV